MPISPSSEHECALCGEPEVAFPAEEVNLCPKCLDKSESLFDEEMSRIELIRTLRGRDVELYDVKHPDSSADKKHCGQVIIMKAGQGFEVKICLRADALDWNSQLVDADTGFASLDNRLDALIGNVSLLIESWGGGPYYMDIFYLNKMVSTEGEI